MTLEVRKVDAVQVNTAEAPKKRTREERLAEELQKGLNGSRKARKAREQELFERYLAEGKLSKKDAERFARLQVQNERAQERVENTLIFLDKKEYRKAKIDYEGDRKVNLRYVRNRKVRDLIQDENEPYIKDGKFDADAYKAEVISYAGSDYKQNLDERHAFARENGLNHRQSKLAAKYAGLDTEQDLSNLYRAGVLVAGAGIGAAIAGTVKATAEASNTVIQIAADGTQTVIADQHAFNSRNISLAGEGALAGGLGALIATPFVKDRGGRDLFNDIDPKKFIENSVRGVQGKENQRLMQGAIDTLKEKGYTTEEIAAFIHEGTGESTRGKANKREIAAFYQNAQTIEAKAQPQAEEPPAPEAPAAPPAEPPKAEPQFSLVIEEKSEIVQKPIETTDYTPKKGEYWYSIVQAKYGIQDPKVIRDIIGQLKAAHGITKRSLVTQPKVMKLFNEVTVGDKTYTLNLDKKAATTDNFSKNYKAYNGQPSVGT